MNYNLVFFFCVYCFSSSLTWAQSDAKIRHQAEAFFANKKYEETLNEYYKIKKKEKNKPTAYYNIGVSLFKTNDYSNSIKNLKRYLQQTRKAATLTDYYLARAYHLHDSFSTAARYYKHYLRSLKADDTKRKELKQLILQCRNGAKIQQVNSKAIVTGLGNKINSAADDYRICLHPSLPNSIFFSSKRVLNNNTQESNLYRANQEQGTFSKARPLNQRYNTAVSETLLAFFDNGYQLLLLKELSDGSSCVFKENFDKDSIEVLLPFSGELTTEHWDSDHFFVNDSTLLFASTRSGGFGGSDLYYSIKKAGVWQKAVNLGSVINSSADESSPFATQDGLHLFFSSNRATGMGGHDIYQAIFDQRNSQFESIKNMGVPLNSSGDDKDFILKDNTKGYLSSNRRGGEGGFDLYSIYFRTAPISSTTINSISFVQLLEQTISKTLNNTLATPSNPQVSPSLPRPPLTSNTTTKKYSLSPIYYEANTGQLKGSRNTLLSLETLLKNHPQLRVVLSAHSNQENDPSTDLYLTVKQAEIVAQELTSMGVNSQQLLLRGCSQNYPLASPKNFDGSTNKLANTINQRINITLYNKELLPPNVQIELIQPKVNAVMQSKAALRYEEQLKGLSYKVKLTETPSIFQHEVLQQHQNITTEKTLTTNNVTYLVGLENTFVDIKYTYNKLLEKGFSSAIIVAYIDGWPITIEKAQNLVDTYPDLETFLNYYKNKK